MKKKIFVRTIIIVSFILLLMTVSNVFAADKTYDGIWQWWDAEGETGFFSLYNTDQGAVDIVLKLDATWGYSGADLPCNLVGSYLSGTGLDVDSGDIGQSPFTSTPQLHLQER